MGKTREQVELLQLFTDTTQKVQALIDATPEIIARIEKARQEIYGTNLEATKKARTEMSTQTEAAMVSDQSLSGKPPAIHTGIAKLAREQAEMNKDLADMQLIVTLTTGKNPDEKVYATLKSNLESLSKLNHTIMESCRLQGTLTDPKQAEALDTNIKSALKTCAELKQNLSKLKSEQIRAKVDQSPKNDGDGPKLNTRRPGGRG